jgi:hypothetical protein
VSCYYALALLSFPELARPALGRDFKDVVRSGIIDAGEILELAVSYPSGDGQGRYLSCWRRVRDQ